MVLSVAIVLAFFAVAFRRPKLVPRGVQNLGELAILAVRDQILRPQLGSKGDRYLPFLVSLFFFIYFMNIFELIPAFQFPVTSKYGFPVALTLIVWVTYISIGIRHQGPLGYFKNMADPSVTPWRILHRPSPIALRSELHS